MGMPADSTVPRRRDRTVVDESWIERLLSVAPVGALATVDGDQPFQNVNLFVYDARRRALYVHTAQRGRTRTNVEAGTRGCFVAFEMGRLLPADTALEFSVEYASVVAFGVVQLVDDDAEAEAVLQALLDKYAPHLRPGHDYRAIVPEELRRTTVLRLDVEHWSGKRKVVAPDFPGAFTYVGTGVLDEDRSRVV
jgi:uncharacterized protein